MGEATSSPQCLLSPLTPGILPRLPLFAINHARAMSRILPLAGLLLATLLSACQPDGSFDCAAFLAEQAPASAASMQAPAGNHPLLSRYTSFTLETDLSVLSGNECRMVPPLVRAGQEMEEIFWLQTYGDRDSLMRTIEDPALQRFAAINYGPWNRLAGSEPFIKGVGAKPAG